MNETTPLVTELIGLAGTGKTTLARILYRQSRIRAAPRIRLKDPRNLPLFVRHVISTWPVLAGHRGRERRLTWEEVKKVVYLDGWHAVLRRRERGREPILLSDQGPVFELATLHGFGPARLRRPALAPWWDKLFAEWASLLTLVVWLDAPEDVLIERIRTRAKEHPIKHTAAEATRGFLACYRSSYDHVVAKLRAADSPRILRFDTSRDTADSIAWQIVRAIDDRRASTEPRRSHG